MSQVVLSTSVYISSVETIGVSLLASPYGLLVGTTSTAFLIDVSFDLSSSTSVYLQRGCGVYSIALGTGLIYLGNNTTPGLVYILNPQLQIENILTSYNQYAQVYSVVTTPTALLVGYYNYGRGAVEIYDINTLNYIGKLVLPTARGGVTAMAIGSTALYVGYNMSPGVVDVFNASTLAYEATFTAPTGHNSVSTLVLTSTALYVGYNMSPGVVDMVDQNTLQLVASYTSSKGAYVTSMAATSTGLYVGYFTLSGLIELLDPSLKLRQSYNSLYSYVIGLAVYDGLLYVLYYTQPPVIQALTLTLYPDPTNVPGTLPTITYATGGNIFMIPIRESIINNTSISIIVTGQINTIVDTINSNIINSAVNIEAGSANVYITNTAPIIVGSLDVNAVNIINANITNSVLNAYAQNIQSPIVLASVTNAVVGATAIISNISCPYYPCTINADIEISNTSHVSYIVGGAQILINDGSPVPANVLIHMPKLQLPTGTVGVAIDATATVYLRMMATQFRRN